MFTELAPKDLSENPFTMIGKDWLLITAGDKEHVNTMTASWGGMGVLWNQNVCTVYIRPQRYTKEFVEQNDHFSISVLGEEFRQALQFCGAKSGRDYDKFKECGLTPAFEGDTPFIKQARLVIVCKKLYAQMFTPACFVEKDLDERFYPEKDYHIMYVGKIETILSKA